MVLLASWPVRTRCIISKAVQIWAMRRFDAFQSTGALDVVAASYLGTMAKALASKEAST